MYSPEHFLLRDEKGRSKWTCACGEQVRPWGDAWKCPQHPVPIWRLYQGGLYREDRLSCVAVVSRRQCMRERGAGPQWEWCSQHASLLFEADDGT